MSVCLCVCVCARACSRHACAQYRSRPNAEERGTGQSMSRPSAMAAALPGYIYRDGLPRARGHRQSAWCSMLVCCAVLCPPCIGPGDSICTQEAPGLGAAREKHKQRQRKRNRKREGEREREHKKGEEEEEGVMSYLLQHLHSGWEVDQAILGEEDR